MAQAHSHLAQHIDTESHSDWFGLDNFDHDMPEPLPIILDDQVQPPPCENSCYSEEKVELVGDDPLQDSQMNQDQDEVKEDGDIRDEALRCIEELVLSFLTQLVDAVPHPYSGDSTKEVKCKKIVLQLADRRKEHDRSDSDMPLRTLAMPHRSRGTSARPFAQVFRVLDLMHEALTDDIPTTKRDMYYKDIQLFGSQSTVDRVVDDIAATFQLGRADLNVRASSKGLICGGGLFLHLSSGETLQIKDTEPTLIPHAEDIQRYEVDCELAWVLVVEKEAVFQTLCRLRVGTHHALPGKGLIITGKGYPDVATRHLMNALSTNLPQRIPILALVDGDAYGIDILSVYKYGSLHMQHERDQLVAKRIQWLGIWSSELPALGIQRDALIPITPHDERKARVLLKRESTPAHWRKELQHMLFTRRKAEIEILDFTRPNHTAGLGRHSESLSEELSSSGTPLLRYLVAKIPAACKEAGGQDP
ncbi:Spo11/DNA topoisomerase VI subunit A [Trametes punicea]|nr:Spo11/DNA topoisomerase VI subunit A [Trametes punicea]